MRGTLAQLVAAIPGARLVGGDAAFEGVSTDSRTAPAGALFVALKGETFDAHSFLVQVAGRGVAAVVVHALPEGWTRSGAGLATYDSPGLVTQPSFTLTGSAAGAVAP